MAKKELFLIICYAYCSFMSFISSLGNKVKLSWRLTTISKLDNGCYLLTYETPSGTVSLQSRSVVMTIPSYIASTIIRPLSVCCINYILVFSRIHIGTKTVKNISSLLQPSSIHTKLSSCCPYAILNMC